MKGPLKKLSTCVCSIAKCVSLNYQCMSRAFTTETVDSCYPAWQTSLCEFVRKEIRNKTPNMGEYLD